MLSRIEGKMTVYRNQINGGGTNDGYCLGTLIYPDLTGDFSKDIRADIESDMTPFNDGGAPICSAAWSATLVNTGSLAGIQGFEGYPPKYKLGVVAFSSIADIVQTHYWNYLRQGFGNFAALVSPSAYAGTPISVATIPAFASVRNITGALTNNLSAPSGILREIYRTSGYLFGTTKIWVAPNLPTQTYTVAVNYLANWALVPPAPITNYIFNG
jgi:hypothetical protein